ncbi:MAG TPA: hypothetical protein VJU84_08810 [Pyrinomonadaceae bacterium]|nr:hypothetical protein [Pyrinomonadaceae bacterium]
MAVKRSTGLTVQPRYHGAKRPRTRYRSRFSQPLCPVCGSFSRAKRQHGQWDWLASFCLALARKRYHKRNGGDCMVRAEEYATKLAKLPDRVAAIVGKTYAVEGDAAVMRDDQALMMIRDLLDEIDDKLIDRNKAKRLNRR